MKTTRPELCDYSPGELKKVAAILGEQLKFQEQLVLLKYIAKEFPKKKITFRVATEKPPSSSTIYITGNHEEIANWDPSKITLTQDPDNTWSKTISVEEGTHLEYKFTLGSWETEALTKEGNVLPNFTLTVKADTVINTLIYNWNGINN